MQFGRVKFWRYRTFRLHNKLVCCLLFLFLPSFLYPLLWVSVAGESHAEDMTEHSFFDAYKAYQKGDYESAENIWRIFADNGDVDAQFNLAALYDNAIGQPRNIDRAIYWYEKAAAKSLGEAKLALSRIYRYRISGAEDKKRAISYLESESLRGVALAQFELAIAYDTGKGVTQNFATAASLYEKAAKQGLVQAKYNLAVLFDEGLGVPKDYVMAFSWYRDAAAGGSAMAENNIGNLYENGLGVEQDYTLAVKWYLKAAERGLSIARTNLAIMYQLGHGVKRDYKTAAHWYELAAMSGEQIAQNNLGLLYANGLGVVKNLGRAIQWLILASEGRQSDLALRARHKSEKLSLRVTQDELSRIIEDARHLQLRLESRHKRPLVPIPLLNGEFRNLTLGIQRVLSGLGHYIGPVDGLMGPSTLVAIESANTKYGLTYSNETASNYIKELGELLQKQIRNKE